MKCGTKVIWHWLGNEGDPISVKIVELTNVIRAKGCTAQRYKVIANKMTADHITSENRSPDFDLEIDNGLETGKLYVVGGEGLREKGEMDIFGLA